MFTVSSAKFLTTSSTAFCSSPSLFFALSNSSFDNFSVSGSWDTISPQKISPNDLVINELFIDPILSLLCMQILMVLLTLKKKYLLKKEQRLIDGLSRN